MWWRYGRPGRHSLSDALDNPDNHAAYDQRQAARERRASQAHRDLMRTLACADCGQVPKEESTREYGLHGREQRIRCPGGRCRPCREQHQQQREQEQEWEAMAQARLEASREANAALRPCWTCRGSIGGKAGSGLELRGEGRPGPAGVPAVRRRPGDGETGPVGAARPDQARAGRRLGLRSG
ncbi:hypothetical protein [Kitasatospora sp. NPDC059599]|uniref:hypothetical protein n=1 Tax=Kitasatospora sp. NPDC059599 TaxID=3346880 RepID=UPI0036B82A64